MCSSNSSSNIYEIRDFRALERERRRKLTGTLGRAQRNRGRRGQVQADGRMVRFHSIHSEFHQNLLRKEAKAAKRAVRAQKNAGGSGSSRFPSLTSNASKTKANGTTGKKKKRAKGKRKDYGMGPSNSVEKTPRIYSKSAAHTKPTKVKQNGDIVEIIEVPSDVSIRLVPLNPGNAPRKAKKAKKVKKKSKRAGPEAKSKPLDSRRGSEEREMEDLIHQLNLERKKCLVLSQIVQEQGAFLENIRREKSSFEERLYRTTASSSKYSSGRDLSENEEDLASEYARMEDYDEVNSESASPRFGSAKWGDVSGGMPGIRSLKPSALLTDAIKVLHLVEREGERTRGELNELRKMARTYHEEIARSQAAETAAMEALAEAEDRAAEAEKSLRRQKTKKIERVVSKLDATLTARQSSEISLLSNLAMSESAASPAHTADQKPDHHDQDSETFRSQAQSSGAASRPPPKLSASAKSNVDKLYQKYLKEKSHENQHVIRTPPPNKWETQPPSEASSVRATSAGSATRKRRPRRSPQVPTSGGLLAAPSSPLDSMSTMISVIQDTLDGQHRTLEESKRVLGSFMLSEGDGMHGGDTHGFGANGQLPMMMT